MIIKNETTVPKMLKMVDLSMLKNRAAENRGKFCKITSLKWVRISFSLGVNTLVGLFKTYDFDSIVSASLSIKSHVMITTHVSNWKKYLGLSGYFQKMVLTKVSRIITTSATILTVSPWGCDMVFWKM
jgi:hypothetical protein